MKTQKTTEIVRAVYEINYDQFMSLYSSGHFTPSLCNDTDALPYPLHYITICWDIILGYWEEWKEKFQPVLKKRKEENDKFKSFFSGLGLDMSEVPFSKYCRCFYCAEPDASIEDCLCETEEYLKGLGFRDIDIELACCVEKFQFERTEQLLKLGADPLKNRSEVKGEFDDCDTRIYNEVQFLYSEMTKTVLGEKGLEVFERNLGDLLGLAAHEKMDHLLDKYC